MADGSKALMAIFGGKSSSKGDDASEGEDAAQDVLDAIEEKDAKALNMALKRHYELCASDESTEDEATED